MMLEIKIVATALIWLVVFVIAHQYKVGKVTDYLIMASIVIIAITTVFGLMRFIWFIY